MPLRHNCYSNYMQGVDAKIKTNIKKYTKRKRAIQVHISTSLIPSQTSSVQSINTPDIMTQDLQERHIFLQVAKVQYNLWIGTIPQYLNTFLALSQSNDHIYTSWHRVTMCAWGLCPCSRGRHFSLTNGRSQSAWKLPREIARTGVTSSPFVDSDREKLIRVELQI